MLTFREFKQTIEEQKDTTIVIDDIPDQTMQSLDTINDTLDKITDRKFVNSAVFINTVRATLERFGIILPPEHQMAMLSSDSETVYALGDTNQNLYITHDTYEGQVEGYAQIVNDEDLHDLMNAADDDDEEEEDDSEEEDDGEEEVQPRRWIPPARRDDDSGNTSEY
jgi:hypothetical protein